MFRRSGHLRIGLLAIGLAIVPLSGCTMANFGDPGAFGSAGGRVAELNAKESYTIDGALDEARSHFRENNFGYSAAYYKRAMELSPKTKEAYVGLAASYDRLGRYDLSDRVYSALHKLSGESVQYYNNLGYSYMLRGNLPAAAKAFRRAKALDPDNEIVDNNLMLLSKATRA